MQSTWSIDPISLEKAWVTIGSFDGVHRGHQAIIHQLVSGAHQAGAPSVVLTFYPHPAAVLGNRTAPRYLTSPEERAAILGQMGVDLVINHPFNREVAGLSARDFVQRLKRHLGMQHLCIGYDFALGKNREGDVSTLKRLGEELGYRVHVTQPFEINGKIISSSQIRSLLDKGDIQQANFLLGRPYRLDGEVVPGDARGRTIGIPTANLAVWVQRALPKSGVYACFTWIAGRRFQSVTNVGYRPTFDNQATLPSVETHILDFSGELYGRNLQVDFIARLRDEQRFSGIEELVSQIRRDIHRGREILEAEQKLPATSD